VPRIKQKTIDSVLYGVSGDVMGLEGRQSLGEMTDEEEDSSSSSSSCRTSPSVSPTQYHMDEDSDEEDNEGDEDETGIRETWSSVPAAECHHRKDREAYVPVLLLPQGNCGKENYVAPEILCNERPFDGMVVDNWALGVVLFMLFTGRPPFTRPCPSDKYFCTMQKCSIANILQTWDLHDGISPAAIDLMEIMIKSVDPKDRLSCGDILSHPWMNQAQY
jgi:serine/threonine protein kinase